jgi:ParB-like chromosome segregation protein Spo0J
MKKRETKAGNGKNGKEFIREMVQVADLKPHPKNYRSHPDDQIEHIKQSITEHGVYRNIVVAKDDTILAGHGVVEAAKRLGIKELPVVRVDIDPASDAAFKIVVGDNEISHLSENDDRLLSELLKGIKDSTGSLLGTGYDEKMLAALVFVTRPQSEIPDEKAANQWAGLPKYEDGEDNAKLIINFDSEESREEFCSKGLVTVTLKYSRVWSAKYPPEEDFDAASIKFDTEGQPDEPQPE